MTESITDRIERRINLKQPRARVWRALTDFVEFGAWFGVKLESPFVVGQTARGHITYPGYEHLVMEMEIAALTPEQLFSYRWHPYAIDPLVDYTKEESTLVVFRLSDEGGGTLLTVTESGFDRVPEARRAEAFRMNTSGWTEQLQNIQRHVAG